MAADGVEDIVRTAEHARGGGADLHKVLTDWFPVSCDECGWAWDGEGRDAPVEHGVEGGDLVDTHGGHLEEVCDVVHDGDGGPALVLALAEVEEGDDGGLLVLRGVVGDDFLGTLEVLGGEFEGNLGGVREG